MLIPLAFSPHAYIIAQGTGYGAGSPMTEAKWLQRFIFLETVAAIPGMVGGAIRHLHSLRLMQRDHGWSACPLLRALRVLRARGRNAC